MKANGSATNLQEIRSQVGETAAEVEKLENLIASQRAQYISFSFIYNWSVT